MKRFSNETNVQAIRLAITEAERLLLDGSKMLTDLALKSDWKYESGNVVERIIYCDRVAQVFTYKPFNPFSKVLGYSSGGKIFINTRKTLFHSDLVGLLCHEWLHNGPGFSHGNNYKTKDKCLYSVPYYVSENIEKWL